MKKTMHKNSLQFFTFIFLLTLFGCIFTACANNTKQTTQYYMVSYTSSVGEAPKPIKVQEGTILSFDQLPEITSENYTFNGWYIDDVRIVPGAYSVESNTVLTASWTGEECTVTFTHSDNISGNTFTKVYNLGEEIFLPDNPYGEKTGLEFLGWLYDNAYYKEGEAFIVQKDITFTAVYEELGTHTISYYNVVNGALYNGSDFDDIEFLIGTDNPSTFTESQSVFISGVKKIGYTFGGWYSSVECLPQDEAVTFWRAGEVQQNVVFYAKWTMNSYTIIFDGNSGTLKNVNEEQESYNLRFDADITLPDCKYALTGYDFVGWTLDAESFENEFDEEEKISVAVLAPFAQGDTITLYAHWRDAILPARPTNFTLLGVEKYSVSLKWLPAATRDLAFTRLSYRRKNETINHFIDFLAEDNNYDENGILLDTSFVVENLIPGESYYFTISSYDVAGNTSTYDPSCTVLAVPRSDEKFIPEVTLKQLSTSELKISWDAPSSEEFPLIEKISLYVNDICLEEFTAQNGTGSCYNINEKTLDITPLELYSVQLKVNEMTDDSGRTNNSESLIKTLLTEPDFNASISPVEVNGEQKVYWKYDTELGFSLERPTELPEGFTDDSYDLYAECTPLNSIGNPIENFKTIGKLVYDDSRELYIRSNLEISTNYRVQILAGYTKEINGVSYTSYSRLNAKTINVCSTANVRGTDVGYYCYSSTGMYPEIQKTGTPIGIVTKVSNLNDPVTIISLTDLSDQNGIVHVTGLNEASAKVKSLTEGGFIWSVPTKEEIENLFDNQNLQKILSSLLTAGGELFSESYTDQNGLTFGRYITSTESGEGTVWAFDLDENNSGNATSVSAQNSGVTFVIRPVVRF